MLTGELPLGKFQPPSQKVQMDVRLDEVVLHALEKEPERRYQQVSEVKTAVETVSSNPPQETRKSIGPRQTGTGASDRRVLVSVSFPGRDGAHSILNCLRQSNREAQAAGALGTTLRRRDKVYTGASLPTAGERNRRPASEKHQLSPNHVFQ